MTAPRSGGAQRRWLLRAIALAYGVCLAGVAFWPTTVDEPVVETIYTTIKTARRHGAPRLLTHALLDFIANIGLFLPVGVLIALLVGGRLLTVALLTGPVISAIIETSQTLFLPGRYGDVSDVIANSIGATLGVMMVVLGRRLLRARSLSRSTEPSADDPPRSRGMRSDHAS